MKSQVAGSNSGFPEAEHLQLFLRVTEMLGESLDYRQTLQSVAKAAVVTIADLCILDIGDSHDIELVGAAHRDSDLTRRLYAAGSHLQSKPGGAIHPVCQVLETGKTFYAPRINDEWIENHATGAEHASFMRQMKYTSMIVVPLISRVYGLTGAFTLVATADNHARFDSSTVAFAEGLGRLCSAAIGKARLYTEAHATATTFQQAALPRTFPQPKGIQFFSYYQPASKGMMVGGDWYDAFALPDGRLGLSVGDVSGHGLHACALMASMRNALRTALIMESDIAHALDAVDYLLRTEYGEPHYCTALLGIIDLEALTLRLGSAGHPTPIIWDARTGTLQKPFVEHGLPLGHRNLSQSRINPRTVRLNAGLIVFYTDGLVEYKRDIIDGERSLERAIMRADVRNAADPAHAIVDAMVDRDNPDDDIAVFVVRLEPRATPH